MNKVVLIGRLTSDPNTYTSANDTKIVRYRLAVDRRFKRDGEDSADFINITAFGRAADFAEKYLKKGVKIAVSGRIETGSYTNKDGQRVNTFAVIAEEQEFVESKAAAVASAGTDKDGFIDIPEGLQEELPFA